MDSEERLNLVADVADMYYIQGMTQNMIAGKYGFSRSAISRILTEAKEKKVVEFKINFPVQRLSRLENQIKSLFDISEVFVVGRGGSDYSQTLRKVGKTAAGYIEKRLPSVSRMCVSWGTAVYESLNHLVSRQLPDLEIIQMIGSIGEGNPQIDGAELVRAAAEKLGAKSRILHAPLIVNNAETAAVLKKERRIKSILESSLKAELAVVGIGTLNSEYSSLLRAGYLNSSEIKSVAESGAVGDICANHYARNGEVLDIEINRCIVGVDLRELVQTDCQIVGVACGMHKALPILGALRGKLIDVLVADSAAAEGLLTIERQENGKKISGSMKKS